MTLPKDSDALYEDYLRALEHAQRTCNPVDWAIAGSAWAEWLMSYRFDKRAALIESAIAEAQGNVIDLTKISGRWQ